MQVGHWERSDLADKLSVLSDEASEFSSQVLDLRILLDDGDQGLAGVSSGLSEESLSVLVDDGVSAFKLADSALQLEVLLLNSAVAAATESDDLGSESGDFLGESLVLRLDSLGLRDVLSDVVFDDWVFNLTLRSNFTS